MMQSEKAIDDIYQLFLEAGNEKKRAYMKTYLEKNANRYTRLCAYEGCKTSFGIPYIGYSRHYCPEHTHLLHVMAGRKGQQKFKENLKAKQQTVKPAFESWDGQNTRPLELKEVLTAQTNQKREELLAKYAGLRAFERNHEPKPYTRPRLALNIERLEGIDANINQIKMDVAYIRAVIERLENESNKIWGKRE